MWAQPSIGEAYILVAITAEDVENAERHIAELLAAGLVPYGLPLNQRER